MGVGASDGPLWAVATLYGKGRVPLAEKIVSLDGSAHSFERISFTYEDSYPDAVRLELFYFRDGDTICFEREFSRIRTRLNLPLSVHSFQDAAFPGTKYSFSWKTEAEVEAVVAIYDKSIDAILAHRHPSRLFRSLCRGEQRDGACGAGVPGAVLCGESGRGPDECSGGAHDDGIQSLCHVG